MSHLKLFFVSLLFLSVFFLYKEDAYADDPYIAGIDISLFDTTGWNFNGEMYTRYFVREFDTVYMMPSESKYIFKAHFVSETKGNIIFDNLNTKFGQNEKLENPYNITWRWYSYKIRFVWKDDQITVTTWL